MKRLLLVSLGLATALGSCGSAALAASQTPARAALLLDFSQAPPAKAEQRPGARVLDFASSPTALTAPKELVAHEMAEQFGAMRLPPVPEPTIVLEPHVRSASTSFVRVPGWMRRGAISTEAGFANLMPAELPSMGRCAPRDYVPSSIMGRTAEVRRAQLFPLVQRAACEEGLPVGLMDAVIMQESRYNPFALSPAGAFGLGQLMPGTARELRVNRFDLRANLAGAARYLKSQIDEFGHVHLALAAYNAGPGRVRKTGRVPRISETQDYVRNILANWRQLEREQWMR